METSPRSSPPVDEQPHGFRQVGEESIFTGRIFEVRRAHVVDPEGQAFDREIVRHPGAVAIVPAHEDGRVVLVRQYRAAVGESLLEVPAGTCDVAGERLEGTARRELAEEVGLEATELQLLAAVRNSPGCSDQLTTIFLATGLFPCPMKREGIEERFMSAETVSLGDLDDLVRNGTLVDQTTVLGLWLARRMLGLSEC